MLVIGEKVNVMSKTIGPAMKERDAGSDPGDGCPPGGGRRRRA